VEDFADYVAHERQRLQAERESLIQQRREIDQKLAGIENEFRAVNAYETAKAGKNVGASASRGPGRGRGARRGSRRESIIAVIRETAAGLSRGEILEKMGLKGDKAGEMSVSNALTALTKSNQVTREGGKYRAA
jgi:hypothetical protein